MEAFIILLLALLTVQLTTSTKVWLPRVDFKQGSNWQPEGLPSAGQTIVFHKKLNALVSLPVGIVTFSSVVFPQQGGLLFPEDSFSLNIVSHDPSNSAVSVFKSPGRSAYYSGSNWGSFDEQQQRITGNPSHEATPHAERVPCQYETVVFEVDKGMPQPIDLQYQASIEVGNIRLGSFVEGIDNFQAFLSTDLGHLLFYNAEDTLFLQGRCSNAEKCPCQQELQMDSICSNVRCLVPHCLSPIQPSGHCCPLCGSVFRMNVADFPGAFNFQSFVDKLRRKIMSGEVDDADVHYHVGIDRFNGGNVVQLIVIDKGEYGERSKRLMNSLQPFFEKQFPSGYRILHAGQPHTPLEGGQVLIFLLLSLMAITTFFSVTYVYYYNDRLVSRLQAAVRSRSLFFTPFVFARFDPNSETDAISVNVNFPSTVQTMQYLEEVSPSENHPSAFDNPMYEPRPKAENAHSDTEAFDDVELLVK